MRRAGLAALLMLLTMDVAQAQYWGSPYGRGGYYYRQQPGFFCFGLPWDDGYRPRRGASLQSGGDRPTIDRLEPRTVSFPSSYPVGGIVIDSKGRQLFLVNRPPRRCAIRSRSAARASPGPARRPSAARPSGRTGIRPRRCDSAIRVCRRR